MGIWLIARTNIKKKKGNAILLFIMIAFAVMLLYVGISVLTNLYKNIDERNSLINGADFMLISSSNNESEILNEISNAKGVEYAESEEGLYQPNVEFYNNGEETDESTKIDYYFQNKDNAREISIINVIDEGTEWTHDSIILPYYMKVGLGYKTGDIISLEINNTVYNFTVYGFMDDIMFSTPTNISSERVFVDNDMFVELATNCKQKVTIYKAVLNEGINQEDFESTMDEQLEISIPDYADSSNTILNYSTMRTGTSISALIFMGVLTVFAILLILIAMIVINFNINNSIEMNIKNIGILQAMGYTSRQLITATIIEIMIIGVIGMVTGLFFARASSNIIGGIIAASIGMVWSVSFDAVSAMYSILITFMMIFVATFISALKYRKINVLDALRNGIRNHNFKKNYVNLHKTRLPLNIALGIKNIFSFKTKNIVVIMIIALLTFCSNASLSMFQNFVQDKSNLLNITGFEVPAIGISFDNVGEYSKQDIEDIEKRISVMAGVKEIKQYTSYDMTCSSKSSSESLNCDVYDNTNLYVDNIVEGQRPQNSDEIMLSTVMAKQLNVSIGDIVYLQMNGNRKDFIVCGLFQGINHLGKKALINFDGIRRFDDTILPSMLYVYSSDLDSLDDLISAIKSEVKDENVTVTNFNDYISASIDSVISIMKIFSYIIIVAVGLVIALVMIFLVKAQLTRDIRQYGIYKALGYTTAQLLLQTTMNYLPIIFVGTFIGCILSSCFMNQLFVVCLSMFGIKKCNMELGINYMLFMLSSIIIWSQLIIIGCSLTIRKIAPCEIIQEN